MGQNDALELVTVAGSPRTAAAVADQPFVEELLERARRAELGLPERITPAELYRVATLALGPTRTVETEKTRDLVALERTAQGLYEMHQPSRARLVPWAELDREAKSEWMTAASGTEDWRDAEVLVKQYGYATQRLLGAALVRVLAIAHGIPASEGERETLAPLRAALGIGIRS